MTITVEQLIWVLERHHRLHRRASPQHLKNLHRALHAASLELYKLGYDDATTYENVGREQIVGQMYDACHQGMRRISKFLDAAPSPASTPSSPPSSASSPVEELEKIVNNLT